LRILDEQYGDAARITDIHYAAFKGHPMHKLGAEPVEHRIVEHLRAQSALSLSLLAEDGGEAVGHIAFSPAVVGDNTGGWYLLGPVGVIPARQGQGIGSALIREALERLRRNKAAGVVLVGDPAYYERFGFASIPGLTYAGVPDQYVLALSLNGEQPKGGISAHEAFGMEAD